MQLGAEVHIDMYDDRIEITNPGGMLEGKPIQDRDPRRVPSKARNPVIADMFGRMNYMERRGSGFKKILDDYQAQDKYEEKYKPEFYSDTGDFRLTLWNLNYTEQVDNQVGKSSGQVGKSSGQVTSDVTVKLDTKKLKALLDYCEEARTRAEIQDYCNISSREYFRKNILIPLLNNGQLKMTIPDKPNSSKQKYIKG